MLPNDPAPKPIGWLLPPSRFQKVNAPGQRDLGEFDRRGCTAGVTAYLALESSISLMNFSRPLGEVVGA